MKNAKEEITKTRTREKHYTNKHTKHSPQMQTRYHVRLWEDAHQGIPRKVVDRAAEPKSFWVQTRKGDHQRNAWFIFSNKATWEGHRMTSTLPGPPDIPLVQQSPASLRRAIKPVNKTGSGLAVKPVM